MGLVLRYGLLLDDFVAKLAQTAVVSAVPLDEPRAHVLLIEWSQQKEFLIWRLFEIDGFELQFTYEFGVIYVRKCGQIQFLFFRLFFVLSFVVTNFGNR